MYFIRKLKQPCLENKKYHFDCVSFDFYDISTILDFVLYHSVMYVTFSKAKKHRVLSYKEIVWSHRYFTLKVQMTKICVSVSSLQL